MAMFLPLKSRVTFHEHLLPVCLPAPNKELQPGTVCTVIGWGKKEDKDISEYEPAVNEVQVPILRREMCNQWLEEKDLKDLNVTEGMICAGFPEGGKDACQEIGIPVERSGKNGVSGLKKFRVAHQSVENVSSHHVSMIGLQPGFGGSNSFNIGQT
uniref:Peptidase S1 domain-containing protein n=1 Tax=Timema poppense TaxID=170557 RepID=A0A7R9H4C8_TIMPO|nr:unnamed protein product [Timema poppensis]